MDNNKLGAYRFGQYRLDAAERLLERSGHEVPLTPTLFDVLLTLVENAGRILDKERIMQRVWPGRVVEEGNLARNISTLRKILGDDAHDPRYIETLPRRGYRFVAEVRTCSAESDRRAHEAPRDDALATPPEAHRDRSPDPAPHTRFARRARLTPGASLALVVCAVVLAGLVAAARINGVTDVSSEIRSVAVLPLRDLSPDQEHEYIADGMTDRLITNLSGIGALDVVISYTTAMTYKGTGKRLPEIGHELGVHAILEGTMSRSGSRVRVGVQLFEARTERSLWAETYERDISDLPALQNEIARTIAQQIEIALTPEESRRLTAATPIQPEAQEAYLKGLFFKNKRTVESLWDAIDHFERALETEPNFALAYAAMADTYLSLASWQGPSRALWRQARAAALRALRIEPMLAEAHMVLASTLLCHDINHSAADSAFLHALQLAPGNQDVHRRYGHSLMTQGRVEESIAQTRRALELDPVSLINNTVLGRVLHFGQRHEEAVQQLRETLELEPRHPGAHRYLGLAYLQLELLDEAVLSLEEAYAFGGGQGILGELGYAYAVAGRRDEAEARLEQLKELSLAGQDSAFSIALLHHGLGHQEETFAWLHRAYDERDFRMILLLVDPIWDELREDARFQELLLQIGLVPELAI